jgi:cytochrome P450
LLLLYFSWQFEGQKFAQMEEKIVLASVLRRFHVKSLDKADDMPLLAELILRPRDGIRVHLTPKFPTGSPVI